MSSFDQIADALAGARDRSGFGIDETKAGMAAHAGTVGRLVRGNPDLRPPVSVDG
jgi:hypothetical protein